MRETMNIHTSELTATNATSVKSRSFLRVPGVTTLSIMVLVVVITILATL